MTADNGANAPNGGKGWKGGKAGDSLRFIAVCNQKGGSGKTTTTVNLAAALGELGRRVLVVDLDPQASASAWLGVPNGGRALLDVLAEGAPLEGAVRATDAPNVWLVPSSDRLGAAERALASEVGAEGVLREAFAGLEPGRFDVVLVDCPPALGLLAVAALVACPELVVPVESRVMALQGLASLVQTVGKIRRVNPALGVTGLLACRVDARTNLSRDVVAALRARFGPLVFRAVIRESVRLAEAPSYGQPITTYAPASSGAEDYRAAAVELLTRSPAPFPATLTPAHS